MTHTVGLLLQARVDKRAKIVAKLLALEARRRLHGNHGEHAQRRQVRIWRFLLGELDHGDAERPNVDLRVIHQAAREHKK